MGVIPIPDSYKLSPKTNFSCLHQAIIFRKPVLTEGLGTRTSWSPTRGSRGDTLLTDSQWAIGMRFRIRKLRPRVIRSVLTPHLPRR